MIFNKFRSFNPSHYRTPDAQEMETEMELATPRKKFYQNIWSKMKRGILIATQNLLIHE